MQSTGKSNPHDAPDTEGGPDSILPGKRSGEGARDLFRHIERDQRRKARVQPGQAPRTPDDGDTRR